MKPCFPLVCLTILLFGLGCAGGIGSGLANRSPHGKPGPTAKTTRQRGAPSTEQAAGKINAGKPDRKLASLQHPGSAAAGKITITSEPTSIAASPATETPVQAPAARSAGVVPASHTVAEEPSRPVAAPAASPPNSRPAAPPTTTYACADDYSWVQGKLSRVHSRGGHWEIRYADYSRTDEYGGKFILAGQLRDDLREGDILRVWGRVLGHDSALRGTAYRAEQLQVVSVSNAPAP